MSMCVDETKTIKEIIANAKKYCKMTKVMCYDNNNEFKPGTRFMSWEHCYFEFGAAFGEFTHQNYKDINNHLALCLSNYLASWGMLRNSFLLDYDYTVHIPVVEEILKEENGNFKYKDLFGIKWCNLNEQEFKKKIGDLNELYKSIEQLYKVVSGEKGVTITLVTKVLLGALGCIPAYDSYLKETVKNNLLGQLDVKSLDVNSFEPLINYYGKHKETFDESRLNSDMYMKLPELKNLPYPPMKFLDMGLWMMNETS